MKDTTSSEPRATCKTCGGFVPNGHIPSALDMEGIGHPDHKPKVISQLQNTSAISPGVKLDEPLPQELSKTLDGLDENLSEGYGFLDFKKAYRDHHKGQEPPSSFIVELIAMQAAVLAYCSADRDQAIVSALSVIAHWSGNLTGEAARKIAQDEIDRLTTQDSKPARGSK